MPIPTEFVDISSDDIPIEITDGEEYLSLLFSQTNSIQSYLQNERKNRFHGLESVYDYGTDEVMEDHPDEIILPPRQVEHIVDVNDHQWKFTYEALVESRERSSFDSGETCNGRLSRLKAVNWYEGTNAVNEHRVEFDTDRLETFSADGKSYAELYLPNSRSITFTSNEQISEHVERFDRGAILYLTKEELSVWRQLGQSPEGELSILFYPSETLRTYIDEQPDEDVYANDVAILRSITCITDNPVVVSDIITKGYYTGEEVCTFAALLTGHEQRVKLNYGYSAPLITDEIARLLGADMTPIPQTGEVILSLDGCINSLSKLSNRFPEKQLLDTKEKEEVIERINPPDWTTTIQSEENKLKAYEKFANLFAADDFDELDALAYYVASWLWIPNGTKHSVEQAVEYGHNLITKIEKYDKQHSTNYRDCLKRPRGKIFSDVEEGYWKTNED